jgi:hypothetical protein
MLVLERLKQCTRMVASRRKFTAFERYLKCAFNVCNSYYELLPIGHNQLPVEYITAFPAGFKMIAGDANLREFSWSTNEREKSLWSGAESSQDALRQKALGYNCLHYYDVPNHDEGFLGRHYLPEKSFLDKNCNTGLRLEIVFPSCWNGKDLDSADHRSHVAYSSLVVDGTCPDGFPTRLPTLMYETIWDTQEFVGVDGEFVLSNGDTTGFGNHADFISGWDVGLLQAAIHKCTNRSGKIEDCDLFTLQPQTCDKFTPPAQIRNENCAGPREGICAMEKQIMNQKVMEKVVDKVVDKVEKVDKPVEKPVESTPTRVNEIAFVDEFVTSTVIEMVTTVPEKRHAQHQHHRRHGHG